MLRSKLAKSGGKPRVRQRIEKLHAARETLADATQSYEVWGVV